MDFKLSKRKTPEGVTVLDAAGRITAGDALTTLRQAIRDEVANGHHKILLNLKDVSYIDSSGLGELVMALGTVTQTICASCGATVFKDEDGNGAAARNAKAAIVKAGASSSCRTPAVRSPISCNSPSSTPFLMCTNP